MSNTPQMSSKYGPDAAGESSPTEMSRSTFHLVMFVSCAHALVHMYELALPAVEIDVASTYRPGDEAAGKQLSGLLSNVWRLPWGLGALIAGWLVDRFGAKRMLATYLFGCGAMCCIVATFPPLPLLFVAMFVMGAFASIYHPAGLGLISHETNEDTRPKALGIHGIFGSAGIASAPFIVGGMMMLGFDWQSCYLALAIPGLILGVIFTLRLAETQSSMDLASMKSAGNGAEEKTKVDGNVNWGSFFLTTLLALLQGFVYSGVLSFLPRYLHGWSAISGEYSLAVTNYLSSFVLLLGCIGQYLAGKYARSHLLEQQLTWVTVANAPILFLMAVAQDWQRLVVAGVFAIVHFMHQPIYNSLIAKYTPIRRRSLCYGFSFAMGLGLGSFGAGISGSIEQEWLQYVILGGVSVAAAGIGVILCWRQKPREG